MRKTIFILLIFHFSAIYVFSQWSPDMRLSDDDHDASLTSRRSIAVNGDFVHVVWQDYRGSGIHILYRRSVNGGLNWETITELTNGSYNSFHPTVAVSGSLVHVVWSDTRVGGFEIYYKRSTNGGNTWEADKRISYSTVRADVQSISVSGSLVHVAWRDYRNGNYEIYYNRSTNGGVTWGTETRLTNNSYESERPAIASSGSNVHVVWQDNRNLNDEIYYKRSTNGGASWGEDTRLTNFPGLSGSPTIAVSAQVVHIIWCDSRGEESDLYYKRSTDGGLNWSPDIQGTFSPYEVMNPSISVLESGVHVVWIDNRDGNDEVYYRRSTDGGLVWEGPLRLTNNPEPSGYPSVAVSNAVVHVVWQDDRDWAYEVYYKNNPTGNPFGIEKISSEVPVEYSLSQNYPNPFNPVTHFKFMLSKTSQVNITVFDALGRGIETIVNNELTPGTYEVEFNGLDFPSGTYYYRLITDGYSDTKKMILIK